MTEPSLRVLAIAHNAVGASNRQRIDALAARPGVQVALLTPRWWFEEGRRIEVDRPVAQGYEWRIGGTLFTGNGTRYVYTSGLVGLIRRFRPTAIDVFEEPFSFAALQSLLLRDWLAPRAALAFYSAVNEARRWRWPYRAVERKVFDGAEAAHVPNREVPGVLAAKGFRGIVETIPLGVDVERFATAVPAPLERVLEGAPRPYIGFVGRLEPVKGLGYLVEAAAYLREPGTVVIVGDGPERGRLRHMIADRGLGQRVRVLPAVPFAEVPSLMRALDVLVLPSVTIPPEHKEQFGRVLVEAMAAGVPVIGSTSGAVPEVIGDAGLVVPERSAEALAEALDRLLERPDLRADLAARGAARVRERYAWPIIAEQTVDFYARAVAERRRRLSDRARGPEVGA